jgi:Ala-tRNA(Pro) deacylase
VKTDDFLKNHDVPYALVGHRTTYTAHELAHCLHEPGRNVAKTVVVKVDGKPCLAVLQATRAVDLRLLRRMFSATIVELASEVELRALFPDCEIGAIPPFGSQYGLKTLVDESLMLDEYIVFEGNTHEEAICMRYFDYEQLEHPTVAAFSRSA